MVNRRLEQELIQKKRQVFGERARFNPVRAAKAVRRDPKTNQPYSDKTLRDAIRLMDRMIDNQAYEPDWEEIDDEVFSASWYH